MLGSLARSFFGSANDRKVKPLWGTVSKINALEPRFAAMSDAELAAMTPAFRERLQKDETLDDLLPEAFAVVREAAKRTLGQRHFDVQLVGGMVLHRGNISEMKTGEGKTLVATLPVYLNALAGEGVHVVTVNDYLARRDSEWMGQIYRFLGMSVGVIVHGLDDSERKAAYGADITYGTNNEFGFDYLRDNMKYSLDAMTPRPRLCHRGRSRLHPDRRSAHAADHFRPDRRPERDVPPGGCGDGRAGEGGLRAGRKITPGVAHRTGQ